MLNLHRKELMQNSHSKKELIEGNALYNADCFDVFSEIQDASIDAIICDLPYGVTQNEKDVMLPFDRLWEQYNRVIKENGAILLFAQGLFYVDLVNSNRKMFKYDLVWDKILTSGFLNANRMPLRSHEQIAVFYKKQPTYNPQFTEGEPSHSKGTKYLTKTQTNQNYGEFKPLEETDQDTSKKHPKSIIQFQKPHPSIAVHRTEKSVEMLEWLVRTYTNEGDVVLDNTMGSCTTGLASVKNKRLFIGIEKDEKYYDISVKRMKDYFKTKQSALWE